MIKEIIDADILLKCPSGLFRAFIKAAKLNCIKEIYFNVDTFVEVIEHLNSSVIINMMQPITNLSFNSSLFVCFSPVKNYDDMFIVFILENTSKEELVNLLPKYDGMR